jgi:hypothetical protein
MLSGYACASRQGFGATNGITDHDRGHRESPGQFEKIRETQEMQRSIQCRGSRSDLHPFFLSIRK